MFIEVLLEPQNLSLIVIILVGLVFYGITVSGYTQNSNAIHPRRFKCIVTGDVIIDESYYTIEEIVTGKLK